MTTAIASMAVPATRSVSTSIATPFVRVMGRSSVSISPVTDGVLALQPRESMARIWALVLRARHFGRPQTCRGAGTWDELECASPLRVGLRGRTVTRFAPLGRTQQIVVAMAVVVCWRTPAVLD